MIYIGAHLSASKGFLSMGEQALEIARIPSLFLPGIPGAARRKNWIRKTRRL